MLAKPTGRGYQFPIGPFAVLARITPDWLCRWSRQLAWGFLLQRILEQALGWPTVYGWVRAKSSHLIDESAYEGYGQDSISMRSI